MKIGRGFTLIELLVVISIVGLLSSIVMASLNSARQKGITAAGKQFDASTYHALGSDAVLLLNLEEGPSGTTATDLSGNSNNGTLSGTTWNSDTYSPLSEYSLEFDGVNPDRIDIPIGSTNPELDIAGDVTQTFWIYPTSADAVQAVIRAGVGYDLRYSAYYDGLNKRPYFHWYNGASFLAVFANSGSVVLNTWTHVAIVRSGLNVSFYVNGKFINSATVTAAPISAVTLNIGYATTGQEFGGRLDDIRIYAQDLSLSQIQNIYALGLDNIELAGNP